ncbi:hypothetical protein JSQ73_001275 [Wolbachia endosymbiont of Anopheles demeilloni]|uniref:hypothetical protein n=1 Tax=Wolbachia endosymbiont of Anopheles demeilloni TaxID=2748871 RepID=UPI001F485257|nr:hypothetical protein [Wolbachia endosymbiont of Anopheles demeilloni]UIP92997.1 hypothetical protein JSQ73_001275 [Wolbachia endosymbiont of Anopheles demeilloni]
MKMVIWRATKKGYSEGFNQGYNKDFNQIALIAEAACVGAASIMYYTKCKQQDTHIANAQINQVISNNLALVE